MDTITNSLARGIIFHRKPIKIKVTALFKPKEQTSSKCPDSTFSLDSLAIRCYRSSLLASPLYDILCLNGTDEYDWCAHV